jgi:hypothetical protein
MQTRNRNTFTTIHTEGALLPVDLLQRISENDKNLEGLNPESYHLAPGEKLNEAINRSWNRLSGLWGTFQAARGRLGSNDLGTTLTRERWLLPLFQELGFGRLSTSKAVEIEGKSYPISHRWQNVPLHLVGCGIELDKRTPGTAGASRTSPHSLLQEYLNRSEDSQWGLVSNGLNLRVLRDNATLTRQAYIEFDLESMFDGEVYSDFILLWLICHQSRFETTEKQADCVLERWSKSAQESGTRALDDLRRGVEEAIISLGQGFLQHPLNGELRARLKKGDLSAQDYYRQLLRLVYRLIFLFAAEDRDLLLIQDAPVEARQRYQDYYSTTRLRALAERQRGSRHHDRYEALRLVLTLLGSEKGCPELAIPALGGFLFAALSTTDLNEARLDNQTLLTTVRSLAFITEGNTRRAVDYRNLGPEELGSVYESLLELHPLLNTDAGTFQLTSATGNERKTTGSYYTPSSLIQVLLDSALDPVIKDRLKGQTDITQQEQALLALKVCDPACGSGHFLIAAAHRITGKLAQLRVGGDEPSPNETRRALRDVFRHCIYGVDINPMAVELCKVNLWLESLEPGKPLSFLDAHIKCGNSLVGVGPKMDLGDLEVPDEAFNPVTGDHKATGSLLKKRNRQEREGQESLFVIAQQPREDLDKWLVERTRKVEAMPEDNASQVRAKSEAYQKVNESIEYRKQQQVADLWVSAFFWKIEEPREKSLEIVAPTHGQLRRLRNGSQIQIGLMEQVEKISRSEGFFHWPLEFADITAENGFDCVLGNPPWERIKLQEEEFFASRDPEIALAPNKPSRLKLINALTHSNPSLALLFEETKHNSEGETKFVRLSGRFTLTAVGDINTYALFTEHFRNLLSSIGHTGIIVPTGIATDDNTKKFFGDLVEKRAIISLLDFENKEAIFPGVHRSYKFCLLTLSSLPVDQAQFVFFATRVEHIHDERRHFSLSPQEIAIFNPNTRTMPVFRTKIDAQLLKSIRNRVPVLVNLVNDENPWQADVYRAFNLGDPKILGFTKQAGEIKAEENLLSISTPNYFRVYEAKMFHQYDHRFATYENRSQTYGRNSDVNDVKVEEKKDTRFVVHPRLWIKKDILYSQYRGHQPRWLLGYRNICRSTDERTMISSLLPLSATDYSVRLIFVNVDTPISYALILGNLNSIVFDFCTRQMAAGINLSDYIMRQLPVLPPDTYNKTHIDYIMPRVVELMYTSYDLKPFAEDMGYFEQPFVWDDQRRAMLRAELDAYYGKLYSLTRDELRYILDPQDVYGQDFPGETFRVLKDKEIRQFGEYRTRRLVLEAWDRLEGIEVGNPDCYREQAAAVTPKQETISVPQPKPESRPATVQTQLPTPAKKDMVPPVDQPTLTDFGLYKCEICGKMVMGFEKANHEREIHGGKSIEWKKVR